MNNAIFPILQLIWNGGSMCNPLPSLFLIYLNPKKNQIFTIFHLAVSSEMVEIRAWVLPQLSNLVLHSVHWLSSATFVILIWVFKEFSLNIASFEALLRKTTMAYQHSSSSLWSSKDLRAKISWFFFPSWFSR